MLVPITSCSCLGPSCLPKPARPAICGHLHPTALKLRARCPWSVGSAEAPAAGPSHPGCPQDCSSGLSFSQIGTAFFPPQGEALPWHNSCPARGRPCGPLVALSGRTQKSHLCSSQSRVLFQLYPTAATWWAGSPEGPCPHTLQGPGRGPRPLQGFQEKVPSFQRLPEKIRLKEQTTTPLSLGNQI
uniref:Uncharacterized protein n=1 Tax=Pipistrellus kuhlii TaxID=59472 RepID=A0A7J8A7K0_PIPKU|nr:hypothetical protein mPipKuh1_008849 [Pipistrellus kuhlii]